MAEARPVRCVVYTRKSSEEGLEQSFNSLHAQREACEAYVLSQKHEGWQLCMDAYDDGGFSGGSMERPALKRLMADVEAGRIDIIVVYKVDRLTRSLADFARMVDRFDARGVSFVSVTQAFNTTTSMGRLTLNVLLSFAQFEREVTGERIRDKIAASKAKGMWMGGSVPLGYDVHERQLVINAGEAEDVRTLFNLYVGLKSVDALVAAAAKAGIRSKRRMSAEGATGGAPLVRGSLYRILANSIYVGDIPHKGKRYPGQHEGIVEPALFDAVQALLDANRHKQPGTGAGATSMLSGLVFDAAGGRMTATHTGKRERRYRYYASPALRIPAEELETLVRDLLTDTLGSPASLAKMLPDLSMLSQDVLDKASQHAAELAAATARQDVTLIRTLATTLLDRVDLTDEAVRLILHLAPFGLKGTGTIVMPATIGKAKAKLSLVVPGDSAPRPDHALITAVAQARHWLKQLTSGECASVSAVAVAHDVSAGYVRRLIGAAFLAPDLVTRIVEGRQPHWLSLARLTAMLPLSTDWEAQRALFAAQK